MEAVVDLDIVYTRPMRTAAVVGLLVVAASCERARDREDPIEPVQLAPPKITVKVLDAGREPRVPIRMKPRPSARVSFLFTSRIAYDQGESYVATQIYENEILDEADGQFHWRQTIRAVTIAPAPAIDPDSMIGDTIEGWHDTRGVAIRPMLLRSRAAATVDSRGSYPEQLFVWPQEALGVGARWHEDIEVAGTVASLDLEMLANDGHRIRFGISHRHEAREPRTVVVGTGILELSVDGLDGAFHGTNSILFFETGIRGTETVSNVRLP